MLPVIAAREFALLRRNLPSLKGAMREGYYGLFVTLSSYTKNAQKLIPLKKVYIPVAREND